MLLTQKQEINNNLTLNNAISYRIIGLFGGNVSLWFKLNQEAI